MAVVFIYSAPNSTQWADFIVNHVTSEEVSLTVKNTGDTGTYDVDWGDGNQSLGVASGVLASHTFVSASTLIRIRSSAGLENIYHFSAVDVTKPIKFNANVSVFRFNFTGLTEFHIKNNLSTDLLTGSTADLPRALTSLVLYGAVSVSFGTLKLYSPDLTEFEYKYIGTAIAVGGSLADLPITLQSFKIYSPSEKLSISGTINNMPDTITTFILTATNNSNITGNIANLPPNIVTFQLNSQNTVTGDLVNIPSSVVNFLISGTNTIFGNINTLAGTLSTFNVQGNNIIAGDVSNIPCSNSFNVGGNNTLAGSLATVTLKTSYLMSIQGNNTITNPASKDYSSLSLFQLTLKVSAGFLNTHVDQLINDLNTAFTNKALIYLNLTGGATRTSASDAAYTAITGGGGTILLS